MADWIVSLCSPEPLARGSGSCVSWMADPGVRRAADEACVGQGYWGVGVPRAILGVMDCRSDIPALRDGMYDQGAGAESLILSPGLNRSLEPGSPAELG